MPRSLIRRIKDSASRLNQTQADIMRAGLTRFLSESGPGALTTSDASSSPGQTFTGPPRTLPGSYDVRLQQD